MKSRIAALLAVLALVLIALPVLARAPKKKTPKKAPAPVVTPAAKEPAPEPPPPAPVVAPVVAPVIAPTPPPKAVEPPIAAPGVTAPAPKLAMRPKPAHGGFVDDMDCSACHTADGWQLAQKAGTSGFDHDRTGFPLRGAHDQAQCSGCHANSPRPTSSCDGCHKDIHQGRMDGACAECHTTTTWQETATLEQHRRTRMPLTGKHALVDCVACHKRTGERQWSDLPVDCYSCHRAEYHRTTTHPNHDGTQSGLPFPRDCTGCHRTISWKPAVVDPSLLPGITLRTARAGDHDRYFLLSTGPHRTADCASCHADPRRMQVVRCDSCHTDGQIRGQHRTPVPRAAQACLRCHPAGARR